MNENSDYPSSGWQSFFFEAYCADILGHGLIEAMNGIFNHQ
jgi:hypothetical protein